LLGSSGIDQVTPVFYHHHQHPLRPLMNFCALSATSDMRTRLQNLCRRCLSWAYLTQHLPLSRFLTSSGVYFPHLFVTLFHATATLRVLLHLRSFSHAGSRNRLRSLPLLILQDNVVFEGAWIHRSELDTIQHLAMPLCWGDFFEVISTGLSLVMAPHCLRPYPTHHTIVISMNSLFCRFGCDSEHS